nr:MAG TPA: hypothetical protein [Caudoviricetes sp.]
MPGRRHLEDYSSSLAIMGLECVVHVLGIAQILLSRVGKYLLDFLIDMR